MQAPLQHQPAQLLTPQQHWPATLPFNEKSGREDYIHAAKSCEPGCGVEPLSLLAALLLLAASLLRLRLSGLLRGLQLQHLHGQGSGT